MIEKLIYARFSVKFGIKEKENIFCDKHRNISVNNSRVCSTLNSLKLTAKTTHETE